MRRVGVGVVGTGFWGENQVRVLRQNSFADLLGVCDVDATRAREVGEKYGVPAFSSLDEFLSVRGLGAVTVCTPTRTHLEIGLRVLERGLDLLVEKPLTGEVAGAEKLIANARRMGRRLLVGFIERFNPGVRLVREMLGRRVVGDVMLATGRRVSRWPARISDVGVVKDTAIHDVDVMRFLLGGEVSAVYAQVGSLRHSFEDYAEIMLRFEGGPAGFVDANWLTPRKARSLIVTGSDATVNLDYISQEVTLEDSERLTRPFHAWDEPLRLELENFVRVVAGDGEASPSGEDGLAALKVCDAVLESGRTGRIVRP